MSYESGPQPETKEKRIEEMTEEITVKETEVVQSLPEEKYEHLKRSGKLKKWLGVMTLVTGFSMFGGVAKTEAGSKINWRMVGRIVEQGYDRSSRQEMRDLQRELNMIERELRNIERDAQKITREFERDLEKLKAAEEFDEKAFNERADRFKADLAPYAAQDEGLRVQAEQLAQRLERMEKTETIKREGKRMLRAFGLRY